MLPDLRIVIVAVLSTFVLTAGVGFYTSSRLISEPKKRPDSIAAVEETPVNRIALSWPEPIRQSEQLALDFAVTARALRNPVRDVTNETAAVPAQPVPEAPPIRTTATDRAPAAAEAPAKSAPAADRPASQMPVPAPDIRISVQHPPVPELPPELRAPTIAASAPAPVSAPPPSAAEAPPSASAIEPPTGSVVQAPVGVEPPEPAAQPDPEPVPPKVASRPDPADADPVSNPAAQQAETPKKPAAKAARKKAAPKKAAARTSKRAARRVAPQAASTGPTLFNLFALPN
jgi:hypothetical protein